MRKKSADNLKDLDDGRVIAPMNVDGMPWYSKRQRTDTADTGADFYAGEASGSSAIPVEMTRREKMAFTFGVLSAVLLAAFVFIGGLYLFILFCIHVWFN